MGYLTESMKNDFSTAISYHITILELKTVGRAEVINIWTVMSAKAAVSSCFGFLISHLTALGTWELVNPVSKNKKYLAIFSGVVETAWS